MARLSSRDDTVPRHWETRKLAELATARLGIQLTPARKPGRTPYVRAANIVGRFLDLSDVNTMQISASELSSYQLEVGDVLVAEASGSPRLVGRSAVWQGGVEPCVFQNTVIRVRSSVLEPNFLHIILEHHRLQGRLADEARGVGIQHLSLRKLKNLEIPVPPPAEQSDIAEYVEHRLVELTEEGNRLNEALVAIRQQEDDVLHRASTGQLLHSTTDSWRNATLGEIGDLKSGLARSPKNASGEFMVPYLRVANLYEDRILFDDLRLINLPPERRDAFTLQKGDILLTQGQSPELLGRPAIFEGYDGAISFQNHILRYRCSDLLIPEFALLVLRHYFRAGTFRDMARGLTNIAHFTLPAFSATRIFIPPKGKQALLVDEAKKQLSTLQEQRAVLEQSAANLPSLEKELYAMAATGSLANPNDSDGTAADLLQAQAIVPETRQPRQRKSPRRSSPEPKIRAEQDTANEDSTLSERLLDLLTRTESGLTMVDLLPRLGLDKNSVEDVESLYVAIRSQPQEGILANGPLENARIEMRRNASA